MFEAQRAGLRNRMRDQWRVNVERADELLERWDAVAAERGVRRDDSAYWREAEEWLVAEIGWRG